ncbi:tRNA modification GTPase MnmE [Aliidongia dinghuensis]|uniref:tRNA modification GTPase MnmE n=1 Tax=Aliidongia dinghuensis TaxID=1867774 RepID=A0A8J2YX79_9PROT|nr:tRNA uridine-5-carboxymethylaminomethyl(34) synthesis GTPase MnmE [Aliidongia dinghuensis]GGF32545.1 tRNA modification GTPase MnmE [Aliidongia dinghuensis]
MTGRTIFAPATARGRAGVAVVRVSGPAAGASLAAIAGGVPAPRTAHLAALVDPATGETIDRGLVLWFPGPASFTGEDVAEFHVHGGPAVISGLLAALGRLADCRMAEPGEFTRRAFLNGKLDLTQAEGLGDLIAAETAAQRRQALGQMAGGFARIAEDWALRLTRTLAHVEAAIDFPDEDLPEDLLGPARAAAEALEREIRARLADGRRGEILRDGLSVALIGPPNSGKSSLMNALAGRDAAIVSAHAGTTRDVIEVHLDLEGYPVILADTAGIRDGADPIEAEGIRRARARAEAADLRLLVLDATRPAHVVDFVALRDDATVLVWNKTDLAPVPPDGLGVSATTGAGMGDLVAALAVRAEGLLASGDAPVVTRERHRAALEECAACLGRAIVGRDPALVAEDLRLAVRALGRITGRVDVEDLLDVIFRDFCIGK